MTISIKKLAIASMIVMVVSSVIVNANESESKTKKHPREYLTLKIDSNAKTGGFFGGEIGLRINSLYNNSTVNVELISNSPVFNINLIGGYQWYFYNHPNFSLGVRAKGYIGYGYGKSSVRDINNNYYYHSTNQINIGSELQFLWDFLNVDKHSLGIHFSPIGFDVNVDIDNKNYERNDNGINPGKQTDVNTYTYYTISTGIHYYYDAHHQLFLDYKYLTYINNYQYGYYYLMTHHLFTIGYSYKF